MTSRYGAVPNPWLSIPAADYEAHMGPSGAQQLEFLSEELKMVLDEFLPESVAVLGCATGNGFEHIRNDVTRSLVGIDINPEYVNVARRRFSESIPGLQLLNYDLSDIELEPRSLDLVSCGLFFEHTDPSMVLEKVVQWLKPGGVLATVLQLPIETGESVSDTGIESVKVLEPFAELVSPMRLTELAESTGFRLLSNKTVTLATGKSFRVLVYRLRS